MRVQNLRRSIFGNQIKASKIRIQFLNFSNVFLCFVFDLSCGKFYDLAYALRFHKNHFCLKECTVSMRIALNSHSGTKWLNFSSVTWKFRGEPTREKNSRYLLWNFICKEKISISYSYACKWNKARMTQTASLISCNKVELKLGKAWWNNEITHPFVKSVFLIQVHLRLWATECINCSKTWLPKNFETSNIEKWTEYLCDLWI